MGAALNERGEGADPSGQGRAAPTSEPSRAPRVPRGRRTRLRSTAPGARGSSNVESAWRGSVSHHSPVVTRPAPPDTEPRLRQPCQPPRLGATAQPFCLGGGTERAGVLQDSATDATRSAPLTRRGSAVRRQHDGDTKDANPSVITKSKLVQSRGSARFVACRRHGRSRRHAAVVWAVRRRPPSPRVGLGDVVDKLPELGLGRPDESTLQSACAQLSTASTRASRSCAVKGPRASWTAAVYASTKAASSAGAWARAPNVVSHVRGGSRDRC